MLGKLESYMQKNQSELLSHTMQKINSKWIKGLNVRHETLVSPRKQSSRSFDIGLNFFFFWYMSSREQTRGCQREVVWGR